MKKISLLLTVITTLNISNVFGFYKPQETTQIRGIKFTPHKQSRRTPASVGILGLNGEVNLFYQEDRFIIVKNCKPNTILGSTSDQAEANCEGKVSKVPVDVFKDELKRITEVKEINIPELLSKKELKAFIEGDPNLKEYKAMKNELKEINDFISHYGLQNANLKRKAELEKSLKSLENYQNSKARERATEKVKAENERINKLVATTNNQLEEAFDLILNQTELSLATADSEKDQFLFKTLTQFNPNQNFPCGLKGTVKKRERDCSYQPSAKKGHYILVTRTESLIEIYRQNNKLWVKLNEWTKFDEATSLCNKSKSPDYLIDIPGITWSFPKRDDVEESEDYEGAILPKTGSFWIAESRKIGDRRYASVFNGAYIYSELLEEPRLSGGDAYVSPSFGVMCVGKAETK